MAIFDGDNGFDDKDIESFLYSPGGRRFATVIGIILLIAAVIIVGRWVF